MNVITLIDNHFIDHSSEVIQLLHSYTNYISSCFDETQREEFLITIFKNLFTLLSHHCVQELYGLPLHYVANKLIDDEKFIFNNEKEYFQVDHDFVDNCQMVFKLNKRLQVCQSFIEFREILRESVSDLWATVTRDLKQESTKPDLSSLSLLSDKSALDNRLLDYSFGQTSISDVIDSFIGFSFKYSDYVFTGPIWAWLKKMNSAHIKSRDERTLKFPVIKSDGCILYYCEQDFNLQVGRIKYAVESLIGQYKDDFKPRYLEEVRKLILVPRPLSFVSSEVKIKPTAEFKDSLENAKKALIDDFDNPRILSSSEISTLFTALPHEKKMTLLPVLLSCVNFSPANLIS